MYIYVYNVPPPKMIYIIYIFICIHNIDHHPKNIHAHVQVHIYIFIMWDHRHPINIDVHVKCGPHPYLSACMHMYTYT